MPTNEHTSGPLFLLDGMSLAFGAFFALPDTLSTSFGGGDQRAGRVCSTVANIVKDHHPAALAVAFDLPGGTFRDEMVEDYKGGRAEIPEALPPQFEMIREVMEALAIPVIEAPGYEADDVWGPWRPKPRIATARWWSLPGTATASS